MTSADFAAAQQRIVERRQHRAAEARTRLESRRSLHATSALARLPFPFRNLGEGGIEAWNTIRGREGTRPAYRVGQVDAELLDEELLDLLKGQVGEGLKYFGVRIILGCCKITSHTHLRQSHIRDDWSSEIFLGLRAILFKLSIWDHNASYGAALQNLRYTDARYRGPILATPTRWQKGCYGILTVGGRYGWTKWEDWLADQEGGYEEVRNTSTCISRYNLKSGSPIPTCASSRGSPRWPRPHTRLLLSLHSWSS